MKKKFFAFMTALTLFASAAPAALADDAGITYHNAYETVATASSYSAFEGNVKNSGEDEGLEMAKGSAYFNISFGETQPQGIIIESGFQEANSVHGRMYIEVGNDNDEYVELGYIDPIVTTGYIAKYGHQKNRYIKFNENASLCTGNKSIRFTVKESIFSKVHSFKFFADEASVSGIAPAYADAYQSLKSNLSVSTRKEMNDTSYTTGKYTYQVGAAFSDTAAEDLIFAVKRTSEEEATLESIDLRLDKDEVKAAIPQISVEAGETVTQYARVKNPELFVGNVNLKLQFENSVTDASGLDFYFIKEAPLSPYEELIGEAFTGEKSVGIVDFGELGAKSVTVGYSGNGVLSVNGMVTAELGSGKTEETIGLDISKFTGISDLTLEATEGLTISSVKFNEMTFENPFDKTTVKAVYIGSTVTDDNDWTAAIEEKLAANVTAYYGTEFENTDKTIPETDAQKLDLIRNAPNGDIIFIQQSNIAESLVKAYAELSDVPYVIIVGTAAYADTYGIKAITADGDGLGANETYKKPTVQVRATKNPYENTATNQNSYDSKTMPDGDEAGYYIAGFKSWTNNDLGYRFNSYDFSKGVSKVMLSYSHATGSEYGATVDVKLDGYDGEVIASFERPAEAESGWITIEANVTAGVTGVHDVYLVNRYRGSEVPKGSVFGNIQWFKFAPAESYDEMTAETAVSATVIDDYIYLDASTPATFEKLEDITALASVPAEIAAYGGGKLYVKNDDAVLAEIDLTGSDGSFKKLLGEVKKDQTAASALTLSYEGDGYCYVKKLDISKKPLSEAELGVSNYALTTTNGVYTNKFGRMLNNEIVWANIDFGGEEKLIDIKADIAINRMSTGASVAFYVDSVTPENKIAEYITSSETGVQEWFGNTSFERTFPMTKYPTGVHNVYVKVTDSEAATDNTGCDIFKISFDESEKSGFSIYDNTIQSKKNGTTTTDHNWLGNQAVVTFMGSETDKTSVMLAAAIYDSNKKLVRVDTSVIGVTAGLNSASVFVNSKELADGAYTYKYFLWDGATLSPIQNGTVQEFIK